MTDDSEKTSGQKRNKRYRQALAERGIRPFQVIAPEHTREMFREASRLMTSEDDPMEPRAAFRRVGRANEPDETHIAPELRADLEAAKARVAQVEREAESRRAEIEAKAQRERQLQAELDAARAAVAAEHEKTEATAAEVQVAVIAAQEAQGRVTEALDRAAKAEAAIQQARSLPGLKGRLVRWLAGNALE